MCQPCIGLTVEVLLTKHFKIIQVIEANKQPVYLSLSITKTMGNLLYTIAVILIIIWLLGFLGVLGAGIATSGLIHILLVIAVIAIILRLIQGRGI
ncbi:hypothetical protein GCM10028819_21340 [Spirosoma humi]